MKAYKTILEIRTHGPMKYYDLTKYVRELVEESGIEEGIAYIHAEGATPGLIIINERLIEDLDKYIKKLIPVTGWRHGNAYAHLRSTLLGTSIVIPIMDNKPWLDNNYKIIFIETRPIYNHKRRIVAIIHGKHQNN